MKTKLSLIMLLVVFMFAWFANADDPEIEIKNILLSDSQAKVYAEWDISSFDSFSAEFNDESLTPSQRDWNVITFPFEFNEEWRFTLIWKVFETDEDWDADTIRYESSNVDIVPQYQDFYIEDVEFSWSVEGRYMDIYLNDGEFLSKIDDVDINYDSIDDDYYDVSHSENAIQIDFDKKYDEDLEDYKEIWNAPRLLINVYTENDFITPTYHVDNSYDYFDNMSYLGFEDNNDQLELKFDDSDVPWSYTTFINEYKMTDDYIAWVANESMFRFPTWQDVYDNDEEEYLKEHYPSRYADEYLDEDDEDYFFYQNKPTERFNSYDFWVEDARDLYDMYFVSSNWVSPRYVFNAEWLKAPYLSSIRISDGDTVQVYWDRFRWDTDYVDIKINWEEYDVWSEYSQWEESWRPDKEEEVDEATSVDEREEIRDEMRQIEEDRHEENIFGYRNMWSYVEFDLPKAFEEEDEVELNISVNDRKSNTISLGVWEINQLITSDIEIEFDYKKEHKWELDFSFSTPDSDAWVDDSNLWYTIGELKISSDKETTYFIEEISFYLQLGEDSSIIPTEEIQLDNDYDAFIQEENDWLYKLTFHDILLGDPSQEDYFEEDTMRIDIDLVENFESFDFNLQPHSATYYRQYINDYSNPITTEISWNPAWFAIGFNYVPCFDEDNNYNNCSEHWYSDPTRYNYEKWWGDDVSWIQPVEEDAVQIEDEYDEEDVEDRADDLEEEFEDQDKPEEDVADDEEEDVSLTREQYLVAQEFMSKADQIISNTTTTNQEKQQQYRYISSVIRQATASYPPQEKIMFDYIRYLSYQRYQEL